MLVIHTHWSCPISKHAAFLLWNDMSNGHTLLRVPNASQNEVSNVHMLAECWVLDAILVVK